MTGPVRIVGAGLIGTSIALALARRGIPVDVADISPVHQAVAMSRITGVGVGADPDGEFRLVVVATPPDELASAIALALAEHPEAVVTDVGSVKQRPLTELLERGAAGVERYVGGHPMAGSERSGPLAASADLFDGRTWAVTPHPESRRDAIDEVERLAACCGAVAVRLTAAEHDAAVARISHLPHLMAALTAASLKDAPAAQLALSGQGVRDVTRIAAGDPRLWQQIIVANADAVTGLLTDMRARLDLLIEAVSEGAVRAITGVLEDGAAGARAVPGKHGGPVVELAALAVVIPDRPGALAGLFDDVGAIGVNVEDVRIDHDPARLSGLVELAVAADTAERLADSLRERGWAVHR